MLYKSVILFLFWKCALKVSFRLTMNLVPGISIVMESIITFSNNGKFFRCPAQYLALLTILRLLRQLVTFWSQILSILWHFELDIRFPDFKMCYM